MLSEQELEKRRLYLIAKGEDILDRASNNPEYQELFKDLLVKVKHSVEKLKGIKLNDVSQ